MDTTMRQNTNIQKYALYYRAVEICVIAMTVNDKIHCISLGYILYVLFSCLCLKQEQFSLLMT